MASRRRRYRARPKKPQVKRPPINAEINSTEIRLVGVDGQQLGIVSLTDAQQQATEAGLDLVAVAQNANPPVVRIMDIGKYTYEQKKKIAKQKAKSKGGEIKGIRISFKISEHDRSLRLRQSARFLDEGHKVKIEMRLRGREKGRTNLAKQKMQSFVRDIEGGAEVEGTIGAAPNNISAVVTRTKQKN